MQFPLHSLLWSQLEQESWLKASLSDHHHVYAWRLGEDQIAEDKYPETVRLPERGSGECLVLQCPSLTGFELRIFWKILVSDDGLVTPVLDLLTKIPEQALNLDVNKVVENAGSSFRTLLRLFGIEGAIESLIKALCTKD